MTGVECLSIPPDSAWAHLHGRLSKVNAKATTYAPGIARHITATLDKIMDCHAQPYRVRAHKAVILAAGGFIFDPDRVQEYAPAYLRCLPLGTPGDDGAGIRLGESIGGATARMDRVSAWRFFVPPDVLVQGVLVNKQGERICNEDLYGATLGDQIVANGGDAFLVFDSQTYREGVRGLKCQAALFQWSYMLPMFLIGRKKAKSLEALAAKIGVPAVGLLATMSGYNAAAERGEPDPLGKVQERFVPQNQPPFYAIDCSLDSSNGVPCSAMTLGGLVVDEGTGQVVRTDGQTIEGLYAVGRNVVGVCSEAYVSGLSIADCVFSGRRAGRHAATLSSEE